MASSHLLTLPKELRLDIIEFVVHSSTSYMKENRDPSGLISPRDFEHRCREFVTMPLLQVCTLLRQETAPILDVTMANFDHELETEMQEWIGFARNTGSPPRSTGERGYTARKAAWAKVARWEWYRSVAADLLERQRVAERVRKKRSVISVLKMSAHSSRYAVM
ncbi:hypothetical protein LTR95_009420 [Oleoguttula sp. CCFEE 5521]